MDNERVKVVEKLLKEHNDLIDKAEIEEFLNGKTQKLKEMDSIINMVNNALDFVMNDEYYEIIEYNFLQGKDYHYCMKKIGINNKNTYFLNRKRLIYKITNFIYNDEYIEDIKKELITK